MTGRPRSVDPIRSARHPLAARIRGIVQRPQTARRLGLFLLDGIHVVEEALDGPHEPEALLASPRLDRTPAGRRLRERIADLDWPLLDATDELIDRIAPTESPQGILGLFRRPSTSPERMLPGRSAEGGAPPWPRPPLGLLLAGVQDPGNLGALARTARALGIRLLITTAESADPYHARALRASSGAVLTMLVAAGVTTEALGAWATRESVLLVALEAGRGRPITELAEVAAVDVARPLVLVIGSEGAGIPPTAARLCEESVRIPMVSEAESLGVVAAGTIALYEWTRGRRL